MTISLRSDPTGTFGAIQVNGTDKVIIDATGIASGLAPSLFATPADVMAGSSTNKLISPSSLQGAFGHLHGTFGYQTLPGGLIIQWGSAITGSNGGAQFTYPIAFPSAVLNTSVIRTKSGTGAGALPVVLQSDSISTASSVAWIDTATSGVALYFIVFGK